MWSAASLLCLLLALVSLALSAEQTTALIAVDQSSQVQAVGHDLTVDANHRRGGGGGGGRPGGPPGGRPGGGRPGGGRPGGGGGGPPRPGPPPNRPRPGPPGGGGGGGRRGPPRIIISGNWKPPGDWKRPDFKRPDWKPPARPNWKPPGDWKPPARPNWKPPADWKPPEWKRPDWKPPPEWKRPEWKPPQNWKPPGDWKPPPDWRPRNNDDLKKFADLMQGLAKNGGGALSQLFGGALFGGGGGGPPPSGPPPFSGPPPSGPPPIVNSGPNAGWLDALKNNPYYQNSIDGTAAAANAIFGQPNPQPDNPLQQLADSGANFGNNGVQFQPQIYDPNSINVPAQDPNAPQQQGQDPNQQTTTTFTPVSGDPNQPMSQSPNPVSQLTSGGDNNGVCATAFSACNTGNPGACCSKMCCSVGTSTTGSCLQSNDARDGFSCFVAQGSGLAQSKVVKPFYFNGKTGGK